MPLPDRPACCPPARPAGTSIGKGFQGAIKRWNHARGFMTHGSKSHREHGSIGTGSTTPARVFPGLKMAGHMGNERVMVRCRRAQLHGCNAAVLHAACAFLSKCAAHVAVVLPSRPGPLGPSTRVARPPYKGPTAVATAALSVPVACPPPQVRKLTVLKVDTERGAVVIKGSLPGKPGSLVEITPAKIVGVNN